MATTLPFFKLDTSGVSSDNRMKDEVYILPNEGNYIRAISLTFGCFFTESVSIVDSVTKKELVIGNDYIFTEIYSSLSIIYKKEIAATIVITNPSVSTEVKISYNFLGTAFSKTVKSIPDTINTEASVRDISNLQWEIINNAKTFIPSNYAKQIGSGVGFETIVFGLERIRSTILHADFNVDFTIGQFIDNFINIIDSTLNKKVTYEYKDKIEAFKKQFTKELLNLDKVVNFGLANTDVVKMSAIRDFEYDKHDDGYVAIKALSKFKEDLYANLVNSEHTGIGKHYGVYGLPLISTLQSMRNGAGIIIDSLSSILVSGISFNRVVYPDQTSPDDSWSLVKITNNTNGQGGVIWGTNMTTGELYIGYLKNSVDDKNVLVWSKLYGEFDLEKATKALFDHSNNIENPHKTTKHHIQLGNVENLPLAGYEDLACRVPSDKYVSHKFLLAFMSTYMDGLKTADDLKTMNCDENEVIRNIKLIFAPCGPCGPCCEPNIVTVDEDTTRPPIVDPEGQLTSWFCENNKRWDVITDGFGGTTTTEHIYGRNDPDIIDDGCVDVEGGSNTTTTRWVPTTTTTTTTTQPPTIILPPTFSIIADRTVVNEQDTVIFTITTENVDNNSVFYMRTKLEGANNTVFDNGILDDIFYVRNNSATIYRRIADYPTISSGANFYINIYKSMYINEVLATSPIVNIVST